MKFKITAVKRGTDESAVFVYNNETNELTTENGMSLVEQLPISRTLSSLGLGITDGKVTPKVLKVSLGLSCNYECEYCSQRFVPRSNDSSHSELESFIGGLDSWVLQAPERVEFWGGEPLVYIKTLKPLAEAMRLKYPETEFAIVTNGSLLTPEINGWLDRLGFVVGLSHDGPGQHVRGPDPLADLEKRAAILDLYHRLAPQGRMSFNAMLNRENVSRAEIARYFIELTNDRDVQIGEGGIVDAYDKGGLSTSLKSGEHIEYRRRAFMEISSGQAKNFDVIRKKLVGFVNAIRTKRPLSAMGQRCSMDRDDNIAVDLRGNILTCQNVSAVATSPNGESHKIGHVSELGAARLKTAIHWKDRADCPKCPVINLCAGACMFLDGELWEATCANAYSDNVPVLAAAIEFLTGFVPIYIDGNLPIDRKDVFGVIGGAAPATDQPSVPAPKVFPIRVVTA
jgi:uncharacterized protein